MSVLRRLTLSETAAKEPCSQVSDIHDSRAASRYRKLRRRNHMGIVATESDKNRLTLSETAAKEPCQQGIIDVHPGPPHAIGNCGEGTHPPC